MNIHVNKWNVIEKCYQNNKYYKLNDSRIYSITGAFYALIILVSPAFLPELSFISSEKPDSYIKGCKV